MKRTVEPEWLDELAAHDPRAEASRRDLRRLNRLMGHEGLLHKLLLAGAQGRTIRRLVELGAGDGTFMLRLARRLAPAWPGVELVLLDRKDAVGDETRRELAALGWRVEIVAADVFEWLHKPASPVADIMITNLFAHHFSETQLARLFALAAKRTLCFAACEPRRARAPLFFSRMVKWIGCGEVTQQDAPLSVRAGFAGRELSALWPASPGSPWRLRERRGHLFSHTFLAKRG